MKRYIFYLLVLLSAFYGCTYTTHEEAFTKITVSDADLPFVILNFAEDPIIIKEETELVFQLENDRLKQGFIEYTFTLNGKSYTRDGDGDHIAYYYISPRNYVDGQVLRLSFEGIVISGTRSLASRLNAEYFVIEGSWDIRIQAKKPLKIQPTVGIEEGNLKITWDPVKLDYDYKYVLNIEKIGRDDKHYESREFSKSDSLHYYDKQFNGIQRRYWVDIVSNWYTVSGDTVAFAIDPLHFEHYALGHSYVMIKWDTIPIYNHDLNFYLSYDTHIFNRLSLFADSIMIHYPDFTNDSTLALNATLGWSMHDQKQYEEEYHIENPGDDPDNSPLKVGYEFDHFDDLIYIDPFDRLVLFRLEFDGRHLYQIDPHTRNIEVDIKVGWPKYKQPKGASSLFGIINNYSSVAGLEALDIENDYVTIPIDVEHLYQDANSMCMGVIRSITADKMTIQSMCRNDEGNASIIYNHKTETIEFVDSLGSLTLSSSGNYAFNSVTNEVLTFDGDQWMNFSQLNLELSWDYTHLWFSQNGMEQIFIFKDELVQKYEWDENLLSSPPINLAFSHQFAEAIQNPYYDRYSGFIGGDVIKNDRYKDHIIINPEDMQILTRVELEREVIAKLINNTLYLSHGFLIEELL